MLPLSLKPCAHHSRSERHCPSSRVFQHHSSTSPGWQENFIFLYNCWAHSSRACTLLTYSPSQAVTVTTLDMMCGALHADHECR